MPQYSAGPPQCLCTYNPEPAVSVYYLVDYTTCQCLSGNICRACVVCLNLCHHNYVHRRPPFGQRLLIGGSSSTRLMITRGTVQGAQWIPFPSFCYGKKTGKLR